MSLAAFLRSSQSRVVKNVSCCTLEGTEHTHLCSLSPLISGFIIIMVCYIGLLVIMLLGSSHLCGMTFELYGGKNVQYVTTLSFCPVLQWRSGRICRSGRH